ncbi:MAG TPA: enoyl-CoA hydratase/isomerase family protein [Pseudolysinimonas sp.]|jgi:2-(1,2-epoxy-1,2-dihydrophenyl)acetyl-CoA isomerase
MLDRPDDGNALDLELVARLRTAIDEAEAAEHVRAIVVRGAGRLFCGGGDINAMLAADDPADYVRQLADSLSQLATAMAASRLPMIAVVDGPAAGAGLGLALNADVVLAGPRAAFVSAYTRVGLAPDFGVSAALIRAAGAQRARALILSNRTLDGAEAVAFGIAAGCAATDDELGSLVAELTTELVAAPAATIAAVKRILVDPDHPAELQAEVEVAAELAAQEETLDRLRAFASRRPRRQPG